MAFLFLNKPLPALTPNSNLHSWQVTTIYMDAAGEISRRAIMTTLGQKQFTNAVEQAILSSHTG